MTKVELSDAAKKARSEYIKEWRKKNADRIKRKEEENKEEILEKRRKYAAEYRRKNPEKIKKYQERYWEKKSREMQ